MNSVGTRLGQMIAMCAMTAILSAPVGARDLFDRNTMQGWRQSSGASAMVYGRLPFHAAKADDTQARLGFAVTTPYRMSGMGVRLHTQAPRLVDIGINAKDFDGAWSASASVGATPAWSYDPDRPAGEQHLHLFDSGLSWVAVGLVGAGLFAGVFMITEDDVPPRTGP
ncbi:MAG: hypothetical protein SFV19_00255 [Rhodospirillaceae bacterium]|nr:hypothetical protein [Rhodospirillaceae bacterium]